MTRIALVAPYAPPISGGISSFVSGLYHALEQRGHDVSLFAGEGRGDVERRSNLGLGRGFLSRAAQGLEGARPDVVHCHAHWYALAAGVLYCRKNPAARLVFSFHTTSVPIFRSRLTRLLAKAHVCTFVSSAQLAELRHALLLGGDLRILQPATPIVTVTPDEARRWAGLYNLEGAFPVLAFVGPLEYRRKVAGVVDLVRSMPKILQHFPRARLLIVGDGRLRPAVEAATRHVGDAATVTGFVEDPRGLLQNADIYCHISYQESFGISILEAMALGRCVLASSVGGIPEIVDSSNGVLVGEGPEAIANAVRALAEDEALRKQLGSSAQEMVLRRFVWERRIPQLSSLYGATL